MKPKTFWSCSECMKNYTYQRSGLKHLVTAHEGAAHLIEFTPEYQQYLTDSEPEYRRQVAHELARLNSDRQHTHQ